MSLDLVLNIGADNSPLRNALREAETALRSFADRMESLRNMGDAFTSIGTKLTVGLTAPIIALSTAAVKAFADIQSLKLGLEAVSGNAGKAGREFANLQQVARLPGLGLQEAVKGSINLQSIGISAANSRNILLQFGNAVATVGKGRVEFERAIYGVQQLANTDFPLGEDLNIIKDAIPQVSTLLDKAFGANRSDALAKMGISSKQVLDAIVTGLEKLPRVTGGLNGAFENFGDSIKSNLSRVGDVINQRLNISKIIDKLTESLDNLVSKFEDLSPGMQKFILISAGILAALGPILVALGGLLYIIPSISGVLATMASGWSILIGVMTSATGIIGIMLVAAAALGAAIALYANSIETATDRQERFTKGQEKATAMAQVEIASVDELYKKAQNLKLSYDARQAAVDALQKQYPAYFKNIDDETIKTGGAAAAYRQLRADILNASLARAAQSELDKRNEKRLESELNIRERLNKLVEIYNAAGDQTKVLKLSVDYEKLSTKGGFLGLFGDVFNPDSFAKNDVQHAAGLIFNRLRRELKNQKNAFAQEDSPLMGIITSGQTAVQKLDASNTETLTKTKAFVKGTVGYYEDLIKKLQEQRKSVPANSPAMDAIDAQIKRYNELIKAKGSGESKQLAEILPIGSIAELERRGELLEKAIKRTNDGMVRLITVDKYGNDKDKNGNPFYTGVVLPIKDAYEELENINVLIGKTEINPVKFKQDQGFFDSIGLEYKSFNDMLVKEAERTDMILNTKLPVVISEATKNLIELTADLNKELKNIVDRGIASSISDAFAAIGKSFTDGTNVFKSVGKSLLSSFGGILSELGKQMIQYGVSLIAIKASLKTLNPYLAIGAGVALVALGSGLTAAMSKQSDNIGGGGSGSSSSSVPTYSSTYGSSGSSSGGEVVFRISGNDLVGTVNRNVDVNSRLTALS